MSVLPSPRFTPTETRILDVLADGGLHTFKELFACLDDELSQRGTVAFHLSRMRKKLNPLGYDIVSMQRVGAYYRLVRLLASAYTGHR